MGQLANTAAPIAPEPVGQRPPVAYIEPDGAHPITNPILTPAVRDLHPDPWLEQAEGIETREARRQTAYFADPFQGHELSAGDRANGLHAVIARQANGMPVGEQYAWPVAQPATLWRYPEPWDRGTVRASGA